MTSIWSNFLIKTTCVLDISPKFATKLGKLFSKHLIFIPACVSIKNRFVSPICHSSFRFRTRHKQSISYTVNVVRGQNVIEIEVVLSNFVCSLSFD